MSGIAIFLRINSQDTVTTNPWRYENWNLMKRKIYTETQSRGDVQLFTLETKHRYRNVNSFRADEIDFAKVIMNFVRI